MTLVTIDLGDVAGGHDPDDHVIIRAEAFRESQGGGVTSTAEVKIPLVDGVGQAEVEPGPVVVSFRCRAVADTREKRGIVPASGTVGIEEVLENAFEYLPPVVNRALETIKDAVAAEVDAIKWDRGHVPLDATSISDLGVGSWNVSNDTRAEIVGTPGLRLGNLSIGSIGTSKTATFISQGTASEKPGMWVQAERLGVWSGWQQVLPAVVPPSDLWYRGYVDESHVTLNDLANGAWGVSGRDHAVRFGLPADFGSLQLMQIGSSRTAFFIGQETGMWIATSQSQVWGEWKRPGATLNELNSVGAGLKTVPMAVSTGAGGAGELAGRYRVLTQVTAPVTRFRVHFSTAHPMWEGDRGPSTLGAVYIGHRSGDAGITNQLTLKTGNSTVAAAGEWVSRWITHDLSRETLIDFQVTATNAYNLIAPAWKQSGSSWVQQTTIPLWVWLEVETYAETPTVALVGDSTGAGSGSHMPVWDSALHIHARREGFIPVLYASSGDLLEGNTDPEDRNYKRWAGFGPYDSVIIQAGSNDLHNGTTLEAMQEHYLAVTEAVAQLSPAVLAGTVKPRYPAHPDYDGTRVAYNNWLKTQPGTTRDVLDFSHAVAPGGAIDPADNADGAHLTSSGHQKMAAAFAGVTVAREPLASKAAMDAVNEALGQRIDNEKWNRGYLDPDTDLNEVVTPGSYQATFVVTRTLQNAPIITDKGGVNLEVLNAGGGRLIQQWISTDANGVELEAKRVRLSSNAWKPWEISLSPAEIEAQISEQLSTTVQAIDTSQVAAVGDSQVGSDYSWVHGYATTPGLTVTDWGNSGFTPDEILIKTGVRGVKIPYGTVLTAGQRIPITPDPEIVDANWRSLQLVGSIDGTPANLEYDFGEKQWKILVYAGQPEITAGDNTVWRSNLYGTQQRSRKIVWFGGNAIRPGLKASFDSSPADHVKRAYADALTEWGDTTIVCGYVPAYGDTAGAAAADEIRDWLGRISPSSFLDVRHQLQLASGWIMGAELTSQDISDIEAGWLPRGLYREDGVHLTDDTHTWLVDLFRMYPSGATPALDLRSSFTPFNALDSRASITWAYEGTGTPTLSNYPGIKIGDYIVRKSDGQEWRVDA